MQPNLNTNDPVVDQQSIALRLDPGSTLVESTDPTQSRTLFQIAWERKFLILLGAVVGTVLAYFWYKQIPPSYQSSSRILVLRKGADPLMIPGTDARSYDFRMSYYEDYVGNQQLIIRSPVLLSQVAKRPEIQKLSWYKDEHQAMGKLISLLNVVRGEARTESPNVLRFSYGSPDAAECSTVLAVVIDCYKKYLEETYKDNSKTTLELIKQVKDELEDKIKKQLEAQEAFLKRAPSELFRAASRDGMGFHVASVNAALQAEVDKLMIRQNTIAAHLRYLEEAQKTGEARSTIMQSINIFERTTEQNPGQVRAGLTDQLMQLRFKERMLLNTFGPDYSAVKRIRREIEFLKELDEERLKEMNTLGPKKEDSLQAHIRTLKLEQKLNALHLERCNESIVGELEKARNLLSSANEQEALALEKKRLQDTHQAVLKKLQDISLAKDAGGFRVEVIAPPPLRGVRVAPNRDTYLGGGLAIGLLVGFGLVYLAEVTNKSFRTPTEISKRLGMAVIGHVPALRLSKGDDVTEGGLGFDPQLVAHLKPKSKQSESFRQIRTALYFNARTFHCRTIQVTSPRAGDGKTTVSSNLSISIAQSGKRVLLVDADCRRPRVHKLFGLDNDTGLTTVLSEGVPWSSVIKETGVTGLQLMVAGPHISNPAELLTGDSFPKLLETLSQEYDLVVVDTPPLLAVTDPSVVAVRVDGVVLVVRIGHAERLDAERASQILRSLNTRVLGVVVNGCEPNAGYQYQYDYNYYYKYYGAYRNNYGSYYSGYSGNDAYYAPDEENKELENKALPKK